MAAANKVAKPNERRVRIVFNLPAACRKTTERPSRRIPDPPRVSCGLSLVTVDAGKSCVVSRVKSEGRRLFPNIVKSITYI